MSQILQFLPKDIYDGLIASLSNPTPPSAANAFATLADLGGGSIYSGDGTIGAARKATLTDSLTFSLGGASTIDTAGLINIVSNADATYLRIENQSRAATHHRALELTETGNDLDLTMNAHLGMSSLTLVESNSNGIKLVSSDGLGGAGFEGVGTITGLSLDLADIHPKAVGGTTVGTLTRPFGNYFIKTGAWSMTQTPSGAAKMTFNLGNTRNDGVNNKSSFVLTSTIDLTLSHYFSAGIASTTYFTVAGKGKIGINLGGSPALAVSPTAMIDAKGLTSDDTEFGLRLRNSLDNHVLSVNNLGEMAVGDGHTFAAAIDAKLHVKYLAGVGIISEATTSSIDATVTALQSGSNTKNAVFEAQNSDGVKYQLLSYGDAAPINAGLGGSRWTAGNYSFFFGNTEIGVLQSNGVWDAKGATVAEIDAAAVTALTTVDWVQTKFDTGQTYTVTNGVTDRVIDLSSFTLNELGDLYGTLVADLQAVGILN